MTITKEERTRLRSLFDASTEPEPRKVWIASHRRDCPAVVYTSGPGPCRSVIDVAQCSDADADLIAAARNALPALLDAANRVAELEAERNEVDLDETLDKLTAANARVAELEAKLDTDTWDTYDEATRRLKARADAAERKVGEEQDHGLRETEAAWRRGAQHERMRWRLSEDAGVELLNLIVKGPRTVEAEEIIARCVMPALSGCPKCGACLGANIDCDLCDAVMDAWRAMRKRLADTGEGIRLPGDDEAAAALAKKGGA